MLYWIQIPSWNKTCISTIWKVVLNSISYINDGLTWKIRLVSSVRVGLDPWTENGNAYRLPPDSIILLSNFGITHLDHIADLGNKKLFSQACKTSNQLGIPNIWHQDWLRYKNSLTKSHVRIIDGDDELICA